MGAFLAFLVALAALILMVIGLIRPKLILRKKENPTRAQVAAPMAALFVLAMVIFISLLPEPASKTAQTTPQPTAPAIATAQPAPMVKGIGITRAQALAGFAKLGCPMERSSDVNGVERWQGNKGIVLCEAIGPQPQLNRIFFLSGVTQNNAAGAAEAILRLNDAVNIVLPNWAGSGEWLVKAFQNGQGATTVKNGLEIEAKLIEGMGIGVAIRPAT